MALPSGPTGSIPGHSRRATLIARAPPVVALALAWFAGLASALLGAPLPIPHLTLLILAPPIWLLHRPSVPAGLGAALTAGFVYGSAWLAGLAGDCRWQIPDGAVRSVTGRFHARPGEGPTGFDVRAGLGSCRTTVRALVREPGAVEGGVLLRGEAVWRRASRPDPSRPDLAGTLTFRSVERAARPVGDGTRGPDEPGLSGRVLRLRGRVQLRIEELFGSRAPLVEALVLARRERLAPELRDAFAVTGTAHLLAISGFHVGVVAGLVLALLRGAGVAARPAALTAAVAAWGYVLAIGSPVAAARAAAILTALAVGRIRGRRVDPRGALATAALLLLLLDPGAVSRAAFQLSFAGAVGLVVLGPALRRGLARGPGGRLPRGLRGAVASGVGATLLTAPVVAWHFDEVSLVGVPATLVVAPLFSLAIPGIFAALLLSVLGSGPGGFVAGGTGLFLAAAEAVVTTLARLPLASIWTPRWWLFAAGTGALLGWGALRSSGRTRRPVRAAAIVGAALAALSLWPVAGALPGAGELRLAFLDVGQGDAAALRTPGGRWILVDTGPAARGFDAGRRVVAPWLGSRGAGALEALILTHPDLDHIGGAASVLASLPTAVVVDPGDPTGKPAYLAALEEAGRGGTTWVRARAGDRVRLDGLTVEVLHPTDGPGDAASANDRSVVLLVRFGDFRALLTGDASEEVERELVARGLLEDVDLLKVGHHGSHTSTSWELLEASSPELAVISAGRRNRYGHPHGAVLSRLERSGARILRTDLGGTITVRARRNGRYRVDSER